MLSIFMPVLTYPSPSSPETLRRGLALAKTLGGRLAAQAGEVDIRDVANVLSDALIDVSGMIASAEATSRARAGSLLAEIEATAKALDVPLSQRRLRAAPEFMAERLSIAARTFDYALIAGAGDGHDDLAESILFGSGGPIILLPDLETDIRLDVVTLAWDGSPAAARALRDAMPVLSKTMKVVVLAVSDDKPLDGASNEALAEQLHLKGLTAEFAIVKRGRTSIGECLQGASADAGAGLMVMGGYGHSRIREWVLGGATRYAISHRRTAILMSH